MTHRAAWTAPRVALVALSMLTGVILSAWVVQGLQEADFPHPEHEGLFPLCIGCHEGVPAGDTVEFYPDIGSCDGCHDGGDLERVEWTGPSERNGNVTFDHTVHADRIESEGDSVQGCRDCHAEPGPDRMSVLESPRLETCFTCHAHETSDHYVAGTCETCHVPLARTGFDVPRLEGLPKPADHEDARFLDELHGASAPDGVGRCATCHTSDRCVSCHVDVDRPAIAAMPAAPPDMSLPPAVAQYNEPTTHGDEGWFSEHGQSASNAECGTCHTQDDCLTCHIVEAPAPVLGLVRRDESLAPGVGLEARQPESHESFFFMSVHGPLAAGDVGTCTTCHEETFCVSCHDGPTDGGYHPLGFVSRHAADAFGRTAECASCHSTQAFCRSCHEEVGLAAFDRLGADYHAGGVDVAAPAWPSRSAEPGELRELPQSD